MKSREETARAVAHALGIGGIWRAEADGHAVIVSGSHGRFRLIVETGQGEPKRRYEVAGFDHGSVEALIGAEAMAEVTDAECEAIASYMRNRYLSSDNFATDLRAAVAEVLPDAEHII